MIFMAVTKLSFLFSQSFTLVFRSDIASNKVAIPLSVLHFPVSGVGSHFEVIKFINNLLKFLVKGFCGGVKSARLFTPK